MQPLCLYDSREQLFRHWVLNRKCYTVCECNMLWQSAGLSQVWRKDCNKQQKHVVWCVETAGYGANTQSCYQLSKVVTCGIAVSKILYFPVILISAMKLLLHNKCRTCEVCNSLTRIFSTIKISIVAASINADSYSWSTSPGPIQTGPLVCICWICLFKSIFSLKQFWWVQWKYFFSL